MLNIDFNNIKNIDKKLSQSEILALNKIFSDPKIQQKLLEIEENRKIRSISRFLIFIIACLVSFLWLFLNITPDNFGFEYFVKNFAPCSLILLFVYFIWKYFINKKFVSEIEEPLEKEIFPKIAFLLYKDLSYDAWEKYWFLSELRFLENNNFLNGYDSVRKKEDSIQFYFKNFLVNWFEILTTKTTWSGKNRRTTTTNHCYLMKIELPKENFFSKIIILKSSFREKNFLKSIVNFLLLFWLFLPFFIDWLNAFIDILDEIWMFCVLISIFFIFWIISSKNKLKKVKIENIEFNKKFQIFCEDENLANVFANSVLVKKIGEISDKNKIYYDFLFFENKIFIKRHISWNFLYVNSEFNVIKKLENYVDFYLDMKEIFEIIAIFAEENKK